MDDSLSSLETDISVSSTKSKVTNAIPSSVSIMTPGKRRFQLFSLSFAILVWLIVMLLPIFMGIESTTEQRCAALIALSAILWATEALPLWITALLVIPMAVFTRVMKVDPDGDELMNATDSAKILLSNLASSNVILLLGGFTIAVGLHKYHLDEYIAGKALSKAGTSPKIFLLLLMSVTYVISMFCNNVAAPVLLFFVITPFIEQVRDKKFIKLTIQAIAFAANTGGMPTPIASPQNVAASSALTDQNVEIGFIDWMLYMVPLSLLLLIASYFILYYYWKPEIKSMPKLNFSPHIEWGFPEIYVTIVSILTVLGWVVFSFFDNVLGSVGVVSICCLVLLFAPKTVLTSEDFKGVDWTILLLLGGGSALGSAVEHSGLLAAVANGINSAFTNSPTLWYQFMAFNILLLVISNFVSHTVAAITMMPVIAKVGVEISPGAEYLVLSAVFMDSAACLLPVSSFPNVLAFGTKDKYGKPYLTGKDFIIPALLVELCATIIVASVGWFLLEAKLP